MGNLGENVVLDAVGVNWDVARNGWGCTKSGVDDGSVRPQEGDEGGLDIEEGWRLG